MSILKRLSRVQSKGQVTIPAEIRKKPGLKKGDLVAFVETEQGIVIWPQELIATEALDDIGMALKAKGVSLEELMQFGRDIRAELIEKAYDLSSKPCPVFLSMPVSCSLPVTPRSIIWPVWTGATW